MSRLEQARHQIEARVYADAIGAPPASKWTQLGLLFTEKGFAARVLRKRLGLPISLNTEDRRVLEQVILPCYRADSSIKKVLFVGCDSYTAHYQRLYFPTADYWTIDPVPSQRKFGAAQHIVAPLEELSGHFSAGSFDLIVCNGVFGWGLDTARQCEAAFAQCYSSLADKGRMLLGWDDIPQRRPLSLDDLASLSRFRKYVFPAFGSWRYRTDTPYGHTYDFYLK